MPANCTACHSWTTRARVTLRSRSIFFLPPSPARSQARSTRREASPPPAACCWRASASCSISAAGASGLWLLLGSLVLGCSERGPSAEVAARVNADPITRQELEQARGRGETIERLIEQRLARQHAIVQAIESARSEILARAYRQLVAESQPRPTREEIARFYREHPELFSDRRVFTLEEREGSFTVNRFTRPAEELPLELLPRLHAMAAGELIVHEGQTLRLVAARLAPLDEAAAAPLIEKFLLARRSSEALAAEMKRLRGQARIEY